MLYFIGVGFIPEHLNMAAKQAISKCERIFAEDYTLPYDFKSLSGILGKDISVLSRAEVEESDVIVKEAEKKDVAFLVPGDSLVATTHFALISDAKDKGIKYKIIHNISIFSAIGETGMHMYKFGKSTSIPFPEKDFEPTSFFDVIEQNLKIDAHTLVLLDINMSAKQGLSLLLKASDGKLKPDTKVIAVHISEKSRIFYGPIKEISKKNIPNPCSIIIPAKLHFTEKEVLEKLYKLA